MMRAASSGSSTIVRLTAAPRRKAVQRLQNAYPQLVLIHAPVHASWLNQVEIYFSIVQRKVLTPNDFPNLDTLAERLLDFQCYWESAARPFEWKFNRQDLNELLNKLNISAAKIG